MRAQGSSKPVSVRLPSSPHALGEQTFPHFSGRKRAEVEPDPALCDLRDLRQPPVGLNLLILNLRLKSPREGCEKGQLARAGAHIRPHRQPVSSPSARCAPAGAARGGAKSLPRDQLGALRPRREGPTGEGRRRLQELRATAQGKAAKRPAERRHGRGDEETAPAAPAVRAPGPGSSGHSDCREVAASEPASPTPRHAF